jgi:hypothetical protein
MTLGAWAARTIERRAGSARRGRAAALALLLATPFLSIGRASAFRAPLLGGDAAERARAELAAGRSEAAAAILLAEVRRGRALPEERAVLAAALAAAGRADEAAFHLESGLEDLTGSGSASEKLAKELERALDAIDPLAKKRRALFNRIGTSLLDSCKKLRKEGHLERSIALLEQIMPLLSGKEAADAARTLAEARAAFEEIDLDEAAGDGRAELVQVEGAHYLVTADIERQVAQLVADTMDDIYAFYVRVYLDGDEARATMPKARIRIYDTWEHMVAQWPDAPPGVGGWWNPAESLVVCYDTRGRTGSLDQMLETLFHEASHQFMTMLSMRGGFAPAWLNEGTSCFFEGATAMADHRVIWPDAARGRLFALMGQMQGGQPPSFEDVVAYSSPGSYPGEYYAWGWGIAYFLQEWEDPQTLAYAWRPLYTQYRERVTTQGGDPRAIFQEIFLAPGNPGAFATLADFGSAFRAWIAEDVFPLHAGQAARELRHGRIERYVAAADAAKSRRGAPVGEKELLERALREADYIRRELDRGEYPDGETLLMEADLCGRLQRPGSQAALIEQALDLADDGRFTLDPARYERYDDLLAKIDKKNHPLRESRSRVNAFKKDALALLAEYEAPAGAPAAPWTLRSYTLAARAARVLDDQTALREAADRLRAAATEAGVLAGRVRAVEGEEWTTIFRGDPADFEHGRGHVALEQSGLVAGRVCRSVEVGGEYEVRGRLTRGGEHVLGTFHGLVASASEDGDWIVVGIEAEGHLVMRQYRVNASGGTELVGREVEVLDEPVAADESPELAVHVWPEGRLAVRVGEREECLFELPTLMPERAFAGVFVQDGRTTLADLVVEIYP